MTTTLALVGGIFGVIFVMLFSLIRINKKMKMLEEENKDLGRALINAKKAIEALNEPLKIGSDLLDDIRDRSGL